MKRDVEISAFSPSGKLVSHEAIENGEWYDGFHPLIDSEEERARRDVQAIKGKQFDGSGKVMVEWLIHYAIDGSLLESWEWRDSEEPKYTNLLSSIETCMPDERAESWLAAHVGLMTDLRTIAEPDDGQQLSFPGI